MTRLTTIELYALAGFGPGEVAASGALRSAVCAGIATPDQLAEYSQYANKWNEYSRLAAERDQADAREAAAPDPARHSGDTSLGEALRQHRDGQPPPKVVIRPQMIRVDMGEGGMQDIPEAQPLRMYRGSAGSCSGHERIAAGLNSADKRR